MEKNVSNQLPQPQKEIKVVVRVPDKVSDRVRQQKINRIYDILAQKQDEQKAA